MCRIVRRRIACRRVRRCGNGPSPDRVRSGSLRAVSLGAGHGVEKGCRVRYRSAWGMGVACRMARRRIACRMARRRIASRCVPARVGDLDVPAVFTVWHPEGPSYAMSRPNSACSRRRHRRFTNIYSFTWPWRSITVQSAARLRRALGRSHPVMRLPERPGRRRDREPDITGNRAYSGHIPGLFRAYLGIRHRWAQKGRRMPYCPSPGTASRMVVACRIARCRARRRVRYRSVPGTASRRGVACNTARCRARRRGWASRAVSSVAGPRPVEIVACGIARRWARHEGWSSRAVSPVAGSRAVAPVAR